MGAGGSREGAALWNAEHPVRLLSQVWSAGEQLCHRLGLLASWPASPTESESAFKRIPGERQGTVSSSRNIGNLGQDLQ